MRDVSALPDRNNRAQRRQPLSHYTALAALDLQSAEFVAAIAKELQISVGNGAISNDGGTLTVNAGQRALVADRHVVPYLIGTAIPARLVP